MAVRAVETSRFQRKLKRFRKTWRSGNPPLPSCSTSGQTAGTHAFWLCMLSWDIPQKIKKKTILDSCILHSSSRNALNFIIDAEANFFNHHSHTLCHHNLIEPGYDAKPIWQSSLAVQPQRFAAKFGVSKTSFRKRNQGISSEKSENSAKIVQQKLSHQLLTSYQRMLLPCSTLRSWPSALCSNS